MLNCQAEDRLFNHKGHEGEPVPRSTLGTRRKKLKKTVASPRQQ